MSPLRQGLLETGSDVAQLGAIAGIVMRDAGLFAACVFVLALSNILYWFLTKATED